MTLTEEGLAGWLRFVLRCVTLGALLVIATIAVMLAIRGFSTAGASVPQAVIAMLVGIVALNAIFALAERWLSR